MTRGVEGEPATGLSPIERINVRGRRRPKQRRPIIDLSATGEGQTTDTAAPIDLDKLIEDMNQIAVLGKRARNDTHRRYR